MEMKYKRFNFRNKYVWNIRHESTTNAKELQENGNRCVQYTTFVSVILMSLGFAAIELWMTAALPFLKSDDFKFPVSDDQIAWIVSIFNMGEIIGFLLYPLLIDRIGRKYTLLFFSLPQILSCFLILIAENVITLYLARLVGGVGFGAGSVVQVIYLTEIAEKESRGFLMSISWFSVIAGGIGVILIGAFCSYDIMNLVILLIQPIYALPFAYVPDSPYFFLKLNREDEAIKSLSRHRKNNNDPQSVNLELKRMKESIIEDEESSRFTIWNLFENRRHRKALLIVATIKLGVVFSGNSVIAVYIQEILKYTGISLSPEYATVTLVAISAMFVVPIVFLVDFVGRRLAILLSSVTSSLSLLYLGLFFFMKSHSNDRDLSSISWTSLAALTIMQVANIALLLISLVISGEIFSTQAKSTALAFLYIKTKVLEILIKLSFVDTVRVLDIYGVLWIYAIVSLLLCLTSFRFAPETKGKSLEEIQLLLD